MSESPAETANESGSETGDQPWLGLVPYSEEDQRLFHGREREVGELFRLIRREALTVVFGRSGTGKSSLLKAGVFPKLREARYLPIWIRLDQSDQAGHDRQIQGRINEAVSSSRIEPEILNEPVGGGGETVWEYLHRTEFWDQRNQPVTPVLIFDQFEELFTLGGNHEGNEAFLEELADLVENYIPQSVRERVETGDVKLPACYSEQRYKVVITLREDFVARLDGLRKAMPSVMHNRFYLKQMDGEQALQVVLKPGGRLVDEPVAREIIEFVAADTVESESENGDRDSEDAVKRLQVEPALLSLVCRELNQRRIRDGAEKITLEQVRGSREDILEGFYESSLEGLSETDRAFIEDRLVTASGFRSTVPLEDAIQADLTGDEVETLVSRRLIRKEDRLGIPHIELTHDVLTGVVARSRDSRKEREHLESQLRQREEEEQDRRQILKLARAKRARRVWTGVSVVITCLALFAWQSARKNKKLAELLTEKSDELAEQNRLAEARALALNSVMVSDSDPELGLLLSSEAAIPFDVTDSAGRRSKKVPREIELALRTSTRNSLIRNRYEGHQDQLYSVDFHPSGRYLVTGAKYEDGKARIWDVGTGKEIGSLDHEVIPDLDEEKTTVACARFSPDGKRIITATYRDGDGKGGYAHIWKVEFVEPEGDTPARANAKPVTTFRGHRQQSGKGAYVTSAAWKPVDGALVATGGRDNFVRLWNPETGDEISRLVGHTGWIRSVDFSPDGGRLLSTSNDGRAIIWDLGSVLGQDRTAGERPADSSQAGAVEELPATGSETEEQGRKLHVLDFREKIPGSLDEFLNFGVFSPDGTRVATVGNDKRLCVWDAITGNLLAAESHPDIPMSVDFIDQNRLVTACNDATIRFWELRHPWGETGEFSTQDAPAELVLHSTGAQRGHNDWVRTVATSPDQRTVVTGGKDRSVRLWQLPSGGELAVLFKQDTVYNCGDIHNYDGRTGEIPAGLIGFAGSSRGEIHGWDVYNESQLFVWGAEAKEENGNSQEGGANGEEIRHTAAVRAISVNPDGSRLVTCSNDMTAIIWDASNGNALFHLTGHQGEKIPGEAERKGGGVVYQVRFNSNGDSVVTASNDGTARVWNAKTGEPGIMLIPGRRRFYRSDFDDVPGLVQKLADGKVPLSGFLWRRFADEEKSLLTLEEFPEDKMTEAKDLLRNRFDELLEVDLAGEAGNTTSMQLRRRTRILLAENLPGDRRKLRNRLLIEDAFPDEIERIVSRVYDARFNNKGDRIVTADFSADTATVWNAKSGEPVTILAQKSSDFEGGHSDIVLSAAFSPVGRQVVTACTDGNCRVWDAESGKLEKRIPLGVAVRSAEFNADGDLLLTGTTDGNARIWTLPEYHLRGELRGHTDVVKQAKFRRFQSEVETAEDPNSSKETSISYVVTESIDGTVRISFENPWDVYNLAKEQRITRKLTLEERDIFKVERKLDDDELVYYVKEGEISQEQADYYRAHNQFPPVETKSSSD